MKYSIWCYLFGHKWIAKTNIKQFGYTITWDIISTNFCQRCGLSKEEVGVTKVTK